MRNSNEVKDVVMETLNWLASSVKEMDAILMDLRGEVIVTGTDTMTDEEAGECWIDEADSEAAEAILRELALELLTEEQKLEMNDEYIGPTPGADREKLLNDVIDVQERMSKGMSLIQECNDRLNYFTGGHRVPRDVFMGWVDRRKKLWSHWFTLKDECQKIIGEERGVWVDYFNLLNNPVDARNVFGDPEDFDEQIHLVVSTRETPREIGNGLVLLNELVSVTPQRRLYGELEAHLADMAEYDRSYTARERKYKRRNMELFLNIKNILH